MLRYRSSRGRIDCEAYSGALQAAGGTVPSLISGASRAYTESALPLFRPDSIDALQDSCRRIVPVGDAARRRSPPRRPRRFGAMSSTATATGSRRPARGCAPPFSTGSRTSIVTTIQSAAPSSGSPSTAPSRRAFSARRCLTRPCLVSYACRGCGYKNLLAAGVSTPPGRGNLKPLRHGAGISSESRSERRRGEGSSLRARPFGPPGDSGARRMRRAGRSDGRSST